MKKDSLLFMIAACMIAAVLCISVDFPIRGADLEDIYQVNTGANGEIDQSEALSAHSRLWMTFKNPEPDNAADGAYRVSGLRKEAFPDWYGGCYLNKYGNLVVMTAGERDAAAQEALEKEIAETAGSDHLVFRKTEFSFAHLMEGYDILSAYIVSEEYTGKAAGERFIAGYGIDESANRFAVDVVSGHEDEAREILKKGGLDKEVQINTVSGFAQLTNNDAGSSAEAEESSRKDSSSEKNTGKSRSCSIRKSDISE